MYKYLRLKTLRKMNNLSQSDIALFLGTSQKQYSRWETGETEIPFHCVIELATLYGVSVDYIAVFHMFVINDLEDLKK